MRPDAGHEGCAEIAQVVHVRAHARLLVRSPRATLRMRVLTNRARRSYVMPPQRACYDAQVFYWARSSELASGLEAHLGAAVHAWLAEQWTWWPRVAYPGRDISWDDWEALPEL